MKEWNAFKNGSFLRNFDTEKMLRDLCQKVKGKKCVTIIGRRCIRCKGSSMLRFLPIDPMVSGSNPPSFQLSLRAIAGVGITRYGHIERKDLDTA